MIGRFFKWWGRELAACLPSSLLRSSGEASSVLEITLSRDRIAYRHRSGGSLEQLGELDRNTRPVVISTTIVSASAREALHAVIRGLHPEKIRCEVVADEYSCLRKKINLPLAAEENLEQVLAFEMERHTPFHADDVYFDYRLLNRDAQARRLEVEFLVMRKAAVDEALAVLDEWDPRPAKGVFDGTRKSLTFFPRAFRKSAAVSVNRVLLAANFAVLILALLIPLQRQESYLDELRERVDAARARALSSVDIQERIEALRGEIESLSLARSDSGSMVELVEELSRLLPDNTWLHRLEIRDGEMHIQGFSDTASALVGMVEGSELFRDARFGSPITRDVRTGKERFQVSAKLAPRQHGLATARNRTGREG